MRMEFTREMLSARVRLFGCEATTSRIAESGVAAARPDFVAPLEATAFDDALSAAVFFGVLLVGGAVTGCEAAGDAVGFGN